jgi:hypothetical protein
MVLLGALCAGVLQAAASSAAAEPLATDRTIVLGVRNYSQMTPATLDRALREVARLFKEIGIEVVHTQKVDQTPLPRFHLLIVDRVMEELRAGSRELLGAAPRTMNETGHLAYVFHQPIRSLSDAHSVDVAVVAAHAIAHEMGHMLLPSGHSAKGLMHAHWGAREVRAAAGGRLKFSQEETALLRAALGEPAPLLVRR